MRIADVIVAAGVESMTACPVNLDISDTFDSELLAMRKEEYIPMGLTAENVAERCGHHPPGDGGTGGGEPSPCSGRPGCRKV